MKRFFFLALIFNLLAGASCRSVAPWREAHLDGEALSLVWTFDSGAPINLPPQPAGDVVIVAPQNEGLVALDIQRGSVAWVYHPQGGVWDRAIANDGERVYFGVPGGRVVALEAGNGKLVWEQELGSDVQAPLSLFDGVLYASTTFVGPGLAGDPSGRASLFALRPQDGAVLWEFKSESYILQSAFKVGDSVYTGGSYQDSRVEVEEGGPLKIYSLSARDGALQWVYESQDGYVKGLYANQQAVAYIAYQDFTIGLNALDGALLWRKDTGNWVPNLMGSGDLVYYGSANTVVQAVSIEDGATVWEYNIGGGSFNYLLGKPVRAGDELYFLSQQGDMIGLDARDGSELWVVPTGITSREGLSVAGSWLFMGDQDGAVYAYQGGE